MCAACLAHIIWFNHFLASFYGWPKLLCKKFWAFWNLWNLFCQFVHVFPKPAMQWWLHYGEFFKILYWIILHEKLIRELNQHWNIQDSDSYSSFLLIYMISAFLCAISMSFIFVHFQPFSIELSLALTNTMMEIWKISKEKGVLNIILAGPHQKTLLKDRHQDVSLFGNKAILKVYWSTSMSFCPSRGTILFWTWSDSIFEKVSNSHINREVT